jgi:hypothetical protein
MRAKFGRVRQALAVLEFARADRLDDPFLQLLVDWA